LSLEVRNYQIPHKKALAGHDGVQRKCQKKGTVFDESRDSSETMKMPKPKRQTDPVPNESEEFLPPQE
jgi:hypothetical protein